MNTGIQDAVDLGWKLEAAIRGWGGHGSACVLRDRAAPGRGAQRRPRPVPTSARMLSTRQRLPPPGDLRAGPQGDAARKDYGAWFSDDDEARMVHARLPSRLPLRGLAGDLAGRHARAAARNLDLHADRAAGPSRAACVSAGWPLDARFVRPRLHAAALGPDAPDGDASTCGSSERRRAAAGRRCSIRRKSRRSMSAASSWCGPTVTSPGVPTAEPDDARALIDVVRGARSYANVAAPKGAPASPGPRPAVHAAQTTGG